MRYFTYLTAVFFLLAFGIRILSMAESLSSSDSMKGIAVTAIITSLITIIVMFNFRKLNE